MTTFLITLISLWSFPIVGFFIYYLTKKRIPIRKKILTILLITNLLAVFGLLTNISTTLIELDWIIVSSLYLTVCALLWVSNGLKNKIIKTISVIAMVCIFGLGYFSGTAGVLGVGFITAEYTPEVEKWLGNGIIYKETPLGNAVSDYRGKRVEVFKTIPWLPIIEWRITNKVYEEYITIMTTPLTINYRPDEQKIYLSASMWWEKEHKQQEWSDTIFLKQY
jgi:hypothetical protein